MRLAALGIHSEINTFAAAPTDDEAVTNATIGGTRGDLLGQEVWDVYRDTQFTVAGFLDADSLPGVDVVPIGFATTRPSGTWTRGAFERVFGAQLARLEAEGPFDGVLVSQHGSMVVEGCADADAEMLRRVRSVVGDRVPIGVVMDTHGNISPAQVHGADITLLWQTNPHTDCQARGLQVAQLIAATVRGEIQPVQAIVNPPLVANILAQNTADDPMRSLLARARELIDATPGLIDLSIGEGFPYADIPHMGMALVAVADRDASIAQRAVEEMGRLTWEQRDAFDPRAVAVADAVRLEPEGGAGPVVLLDVGDNMGAGTPGDSTFILEAILKAGRRGYLVTCFDPEAVVACVAAGVGSHVELTVGGKVDDRHGTPQRVAGTVRTLSDGRFTAHDETVHAGNRVFDSGLTAVVDTDDGGTVSLTTLPMMTLSLDQHYATGVNPARYDLVVTKGVMSPQPAYGPIASRMVYVDTPGVSTADMRTLGHQHRRTPMLPFEPDTAWP